MIETVRATHLAMMKRIRWIGKIAGLACLVGIATRPASGQTVAGHPTLRERVVTKGAGPFILGLAFAPDGRTLATVERGGKVRIRGVIDLRELKVLVGHSVSEAEARDLPGRRDPGEHLRDAFRVVYYPDGQSLATSGRDGTVRVWDFSTGAERFRLADHQGMVYSLVLSPDGNQLISGDVLTPSGQGGVRFWDARTGRRLADRIDYHSMIRDLALSVDGSKLATTSGDSTARLWDVGSGRPLAVFHGEARFMNRVSIAPDGQTVVTTGSDKSIRVFDAGTGQERHKIEGGNWGSSSLSFSPDGTLLATFADDRVVLWKTRDWTEAASYRSPGDLPNQAIFAPDGKLLGVGGRNGSVRLLTVEP